MDNIIDIGTGLVLKNRKILLVEKSSHGRYELPGGRKDPAETLLETAVRETKEETGIDAIFMKEPYLISVGETPSGRKRYTVFIGKPKFLYMLEHPIVGREELEYLKKALYVNIDELPFLENHGKLQPLVSMVYRRLIGSNLEGGSMAEPINL